MAIEGSSSEYTQGTDNPAVTRLLFRLAKWRWASPFRLLSILVGVTIPRRDWGTTRMPHPIGIVIHSTTVIGDGVVIMQNVTIAGHPRSPRGAIIGDGVQIGAGAVVIGPVRIGAHAVVGANAVVTHDVPAQTVVAGSPAVPVTTSRYKL